ncbi:hypothetical protein KQI65_12650 [bacterium]|nr:hypothetical protein [bacterium]
MLGLQAQERDPCGFASEQGLGRKSEAQRWGYDFADMLANVQAWNLHPSVDAQLLGYSVQRRPLFHLQITNPASHIPKRRIWLHARTHPIESESSEVLRALIDELLSDSPLAERVLDHCVIDILPMVNPDGVVLRYPRENANGVDLESNWGSSTPEAEVNALRNRLRSLMQSDMPIEIALNLHSAYDCKRYFVYHAAEGSSILFTQLQQQFINAVRTAFPGGIEPYDYFVSWTGGTPDRYPESWFWRNYGESVMALTYEDMNCTAAGDFDRTARALLEGSLAYLGIDGPLDAHPMAAAQAPEIEGLFPQPAHVDGSFTLQLGGAAGGSSVHIALYDELGRMVRRIWEGRMTAETRSLQIPLSGLAAGSYHLVLHSPAGMQRRLLLIGG